MSIRRLTRLTSPFSNKCGNHWVALRLYFGYYNFCRIHQTLRGDSCDGGRDYRLSVKGKRTDENTSKHGSVTIPNARLVDKLVLLNVCPSIT
jgi:hypothetical protein